MRRLKCQFALFCILLCISVLVILLSNHEPVGHYLAESTEQQTNRFFSQKIELEAPSLYYCNFPTQAEAETSEEGKPPNPNWSLQQVQVVIRHGDRSPIYDSLYKSLHVEPRYCNLSPSRQPTHPMLDSFIQTIISDYAKLRMLKQAPPVYPFPNAIKCGSATLSQLGVVQHLQNGELLRKTYVHKHGLLSGISNYDLSTKVSVLSTVKSRTIQSSIAFLYGLIPGFHLDQVKIKYSLSDLFRKRQCLSAKLLNGKVNKLRNKVYMERQQANSTFQKLSKGFKTTDHSGGLIDGFITGFLCKGLKLPCNNDTCVTLSDLDALMLEEEYLCKELSTKTPYTNQSMLAMHPLLTRTVEIMEKKASNAKESLLISVVSGHDTTLKPLIRSLGIPEFRWPRLGSRLVFELWRDNSSGEYYVRILLNAKNLTALTNFCNSDVGTKDGQLCTLKQFQHYVEVEMPNHFGFDTMMEACNAKL